MYWYKYFISYSIKIPSTCSYLCGGFTYIYVDINLMNSVSKHPCKSSCSLKQVTELRLEPAV